MHFRLMEEPDFKGAIACRRWIISVNDFKRYIGWGLGEAFVIENKHEQVGMACAIYFDCATWFGRLFVKKNWQAYGLGSQFMEWILAHIKNIRPGVPIYLLAREDFLHFYQRLGFELVDQLFIFEKYITEWFPFSIPIDEIATGTLLEIAAYDESKVSYYRFALLSLYFDAYPHLTGIVKSEGQVLGYAMAHREPAGFKIGPWICCDSTLAQQLIISIHNKLFKCFTKVEVPARAKMGQDILADLNFTKQTDPLYLLALDGRESAWNSDGILAIASQIFG